MSKKEKCPECNRILRLRSFIFNKKVGKKICHRCDKRIGTNKYYTSLREQPKGKIGKFSLSDEEKNRLWRKYLSKGYNSSGAWRMVYNNLSELRKVRAYSKQNRRKEIIKKNYEESKKREINKKFIKGLK